MLNILILGVMFCIIILLCLISFAGGWFVSAKIKRTIKTEAEPMTETQKKELEKQKREYMNFLNYNGKEQ